MKSHSKCENITKKVANLVALAHLRPIRTILVRIRIGSIRGDHEEPNEGRKCKGKFPELHVGDITLMFLL